MKFAWQIADGMSYLSSRSVSQRIWVQLDMNSERLGNTMKNVIDIELQDKQKAVPTILIETYARVFINKWIN